jgi:hypothetical protein
MKPYFTDLKGKGFSTFNSFVFYNSVVAIGFPLAKREDLYMCPSCRGCGEIYDPNQKPDAYEGYKLVDRIDCLVCNKFGYGDFKFAWIKEYKNVRKTQIDQEKKKSVTKKIRNAALKKLTSEEKRVLGLANRNR